MRRFLPAVCSLALAVCFASRVEAETFTVFAAASLTDTLREIGRAHERRTGDKPRFSFAGSSTLARQIEAGAPADLFVSADEAQMDLLERRGVIDRSSRRPLLGNTLVVITAPDGPELTNPGDLARPEIRRIAMGNPKAVPAGVYGRLHLEKLGLWERLRTKVVPTEHVRAAFAAVVAGNTEAGIVYRTDAAEFRNVRIAFELEAPDGPAIRYPAALVADGRHRGAAAKFLEELGSDRAGDLFRKHGFTLLREP